MHKKVLHFFTAEYPYNSGEAFIENEMPYLGNNFDKIFIYPHIKASKFQREIPGNAEIVHIPIPKSNSSNRYLLFIKNFWFVLFVLIDELRSVSDYRYFLSKLRFFFSYFLSAIENADTLFVNANIKNDDVVYSYWMNEWVPLLSILKHQDKIPSFSFRVLGFDIYNERHPGNYIPFRYLNYKYTKKVYCVSKEAKKYLNEKNIFKEKLDVSYLGTKDFGISNKSNNDILTIYSCSRLVALKRINLLVDALMNTKSRIHWIHQGNGPELERILKMCQNLPENVLFTHGGFKETHSDMMNFIKSLEADVFINLSESEGLPVTMMESISLGIPIIATDVGGVKEIVTPSTGILLEKDFKLNELTQLIDNFNLSRLGEDNFKLGVRQFWEQNFSAYENYPKFIKSLQNK